MEAPILNNLGNIDFHFDADFSKALRDDAEGLLKDMRFPTTRDEYWKYTRVNHWTEKEFKIGAGEAGNKDLGTILPDVPKLVFVNGFYDQAASDDIPGITVTALSEAKEQHADTLQKIFGKLDNRKGEVFSCLNAAYHNDGYFCHFNGSAEAVQFVFLNDSDVMATPRNVVVAEAEAKASIYEVHVNPDASGALTNVVNEYWLGKNANLNITRLIEVGDENGFISNEYVSQDEGSDFTVNTYCLGGKTVRNNVNVELEGSFTETAMYGFYFNNDNGHTDNHTHINHKFPSCNSNELYKGVLDEKATAVFNGKVNVWKDAQQTNAFQANNNILLSDDATVNSKPELEIYADDVKCSHGSTTGQLDANALFYLQARGISRDRATRLLLNAFAEETTEKIASEAVRELISEHLLSSIGA